MYAVMPVEIVIRSRPIPSTVVSLERVVIPAITCVSRANDYSLTIEAH
jgi:hypothetical protein